MMQAAIYTRYGGPEVVYVQDVPAPVPQEDEVLVRVYVSTVNRTDCGFRSAEYFISRFFSGLLRPKNKNRVLGSEFAGQVLAVGDRVHDLKPGDRVFGFDDDRFGGHATHKVIKANGGIARMPEGYDYPMAAALTEGAHYALCDIRAAKVKAGDQVLVYGATGAIGSAAVQLLKHFGAFVVAVTATRHVELVLSLGADEVIDYQTQDFTRTDYRFDLVFDAVGKSSFGSCKPLLKSGGVYISTELGKGSQNVFYALAGLLSKGKRVLFPIPLTRQEDIVLLGNLAARGAFKPVIDRTYTLSEIVEAYRYVETGQKTGNVIILLPQE